MLVGNLDDDGLYEHLHAWNVELIDDLPQCLPILWRRGNHQRIGRGTLLGEMMVTLPRTDSSMMKLRPVIALMNLARTGISTFWKFIVIVLLGEIGGVSAASDPNAIKLRNTPATRARKKRLIIKNISAYGFG